MMRRSDTHRETAVGMVLSTTCFLLAYVVAKKILPSIGGVLFTTSPDGSGLLLR